MIPYLGKDDVKKANDLQGEHTVKQLVQPFENKGHCVTCDNFFTSKKLSDYLLHVKTTYIGTIRKNKQELPSVVKETQALHSHFSFKTASTVPC
jgi:hypothetical protein